MKCFWVEELGGIQAEMAEVYEGEDHEGGYEELILTLLTQVLEERRPKSHNETIFLNAALGNQ